MEGSDTDRASDSGRAVAAAAFGAMGGDRRVRRFHHGDTPHHMDILRCDAAPISGWSSYSTLNLHLSPNRVNGHDIRVELAGVADTELDTFADVLATAAFQIMVDGWTAAPGVVFADIVAEHVPETTVPHLVWVPPSPWDDLHSVTVPGDIDVKWLLAFPITESERVLIGNEGFDAAEDLFSEHEVEYFDLMRPSIV